MYYQWRPYVPVAERRRKAAIEMAQLGKKGHPVSPVLIEGRVIARTFWGRAWCENLERYSDYSNRLPRGRTYVRNGSVLDLQVASGAVKAFVSGSAIYKVAVKVAPVPKARWISICKDSAGAIDSLVELLQGRFSQGVMERICRRGKGLFPSPGEIELSCSCPDWASMCKHVAAVLYGIGARLDEQPELLFRLRDVDGKDLIARAGVGLPLAKKGPAAAKVLKGGELSAIFGLEMAEAAKTRTDTLSKSPSPNRKKSPAKKAARTSRAVGSGTARSRTSGAAAQAAGGRSKRASGKKNSAKR